jgi:Lipocalin-like domain
MVPRTVVLAVLTVALSATSFAQTKSPIEGVWRVAEVQITGGTNPGTNTSPQPGLCIFTRGHYSLMTITSDKPRTVVPGGPGQPATTDAQKIALYDHWAPFTANAGTYSVKGSTLMTKPLVAKNEGVMQGQGQTREFKVEGNTLWLIQPPAAGQTGGTIRTKLTRVE